MGGIFQKNDSVGDEIENASDSVENETLSVPRCEERKEEKKNICTFLKTNSVPWSPQYVVHDRKKT